MKEVFTHPDPTVVGFHKSILDQAGITSFVRNEYTSAALGAGMMGWIQSPVFDPVLCITEDDRYEEAVELLRNTVTPAVTDRPDWECSKCGESVPGNFDACWNCSAPLPESKE